VSVFVDTGAWFASMVPSDPQHQRTLDWLRGNPLPLVTTDYVLDETLTLMRARGENARAISLGRRLFDMNLVNLFLLSPHQVQSAWRLFRDQPERHWSFTDCTSKIVMDEFQVRKALTFDHHFGQFGAIEILP
jgi:predicted nucleic acid-binding protein